ncbi:MAG: TldD/PmbA family protein [Thermoplasmatota archaeon]
MGGSFIPHAANGRARRDDSGVPAEGALKTVAIEVVGAALRSGADRADAFVQWGNGTEVTAEADRITHAGTASDFGIGIRVAKGDRSAFAYCTAEADAPDAVRRALDSARFLAPSPLPLVESAVATPIPGLYDARIVRLDVDEGLDLVQVLLDTALSQHRTMTVPHASLGWGMEVCALANSAGFAAEFRGTEAGCSISTLLTEGRGGASTGFESATSRGWDLDPVHVAAVAADMALASRNPARVDRGPTSVVFRPSAWAELFEGIVLRGLIGETLESGKSWYGAHRDAPVLPGGWALVDDGRAPGAPNAAPWDDEGTASGRSAIIDDGYLRSPLFDLRSAARYGGAATGCALRADTLDDDRTFRAPPRATGRNVFIEPLEHARERDAIEGLRHGLLVCDTMGAHTANPASGDFGVTATIVFRVENGAIVGAGKPIMLAGNLPELMARAEAYGREESWMGGSFSPAALRLGSVRLPSVHVTP